MTAAASSAACATPPAIRFADALRALAISLVIASHLPGYFGATERNWPLWCAGLWGVNCFFVLSGYLLSGPYITAVLSGSRLPSARRYARRRILRICPLYLTCLAVVAVLGTRVSTTSGTPVGFVLHAVLLHGLSPRHILEFEEAMWTMSVDAQFYVLLPLVAWSARPWFARIAPERRRERLGQALLAVSVLAVLGRALLFVCSGTYDFSGGEVIAYFRNALALAPSFAIGAALRFPRASASPTATRRRSAWALPASLLPIVAIPALGNADLVFADAFAAVSVGLFVYACLECDFAAVRSVAAHAQVERFAALSYGLYLIHGPVLHAMFGGAAPARFTPADRLVRICAAGGATFVIALLGHRFIERPFLRMKTRAAEPASDRFGSEVRTGRAV